MSKHDVKILEKLADTSFEAELLGVTCKRGMIGIGGRVELRNITILSGELNGTIVTGREEIEIRVSDEVCSEIYENIGNCTKQYATLTTNDELEVISISNIHFREGARVCL
ncbi:MAG: hypothetical protein KDD58_15370 [Bdellovibrionales bacterium]|nr:hypothetical protein [Bdellovibrionales bacterium]